MNRIKIILIFILSFFSIYTAYCNKQKFFSEGDSILAAKSKIMVAIQPGLGVCADGNSWNVLFGISSNVSLIRTDKYLYNLKLGYHEDVDLFVNFPQRIMEAGAMFGKMYSRKNLLTTISIGVGVVGGIKRGLEKGPTGGGFISLGTVYEKEKFIMVGIPFDVLVAHMGKGPVGIGIGISGNLNPEISYACLKLNLLLGNPK